MNKEKIFLLLATGGLIPIALSYGFNPKTSMAFLFNIDVNSTESAHIFRAVMGLYLATAAYWIFGAFNPKHTTGALINLVIFMFGLVAGRFLSVGLDGNPNGVLWLYIALELGFGLVGLAILSKRNK
ncbi:DUF4345 domain-containing protein [Vibrio crassostreae]|uniref:DUF4345 domain-containing protein n=1 Tax=Vibrio crassostreae TaxID=246167 RepID=UPI00104CDC99|nr:DUF4345 domain-containing protein [Vibrio crassostreae]TCO01806.1 uncharacterized protein DUF4345 [Vibrio crassostreae]CAK2036525.1 conserved membrane hypothetical protein [Vibrio crassostreae]CAK2047101.1 conserved membrane hypothetical protein [Vibrio crassostreae]CAK2073551.1 conserved membrane hypothetical protein [Vibrio crassostreae]CAK2079094.1 conserved membrane hypothetical protein [Vibrio crassostreae]